MSDLALFVGTRKGAWIYRSDAARRRWRVDGPHFLGHVIHHLVLDPRDRQTLLAAARTGHLGPTIFRSTDLGRSWVEAKSPPAFAKAPDAEGGRTVDHTFWLTPGHASEPGVWYAGTSPHGLFRSEDGGLTWQGVAGLNDNPRYRAWMGGPQDGTPDGPKLHSLLVDPRDASHLYLGMSSGGVHESRDRGESWAPLVEGMEVVAMLDPGELEFHDPHCLALCPGNPDRLYQQNHCGIYRIDRPSDTWQRIGRNMPEAIGDIGFPVVVHPRDPDKAWVFPMDGTDVWPRTSPGGRPAAYVTHDGGGHWQRQDTGLPPDNAWWTVLRQAMAIDGRDPAGLYFGTTSGSIWASADEGAHWALLAEHLPSVYALEAAELG
ncbi:MAG: hypothetical protein KGK11_14475 [Sphingomonadales bacterium]|nr:hypothetical protein [Sphingomonadales bacterium]